MEFVEPTVLFRVGSLVFTESLVGSLVISAVLVLGLWATLHTRRGREALEVVYDTLEASILDMVSVDARPMVPLVLTQWVFILVANLSGLLPGVLSPTADLSVPVALALVAFLAGHVYAYQAHGWRYLRYYVEPNPIVLPFNIIGEISRTVALALRLFGNVMSGQLVAAVLVLLVGLLVPVPLMLLSVLTSVVQAYIFGVLTLVFTASSMQAAQRTMERKRKKKSEGGASK